MGTDSFSFSVMKDILSGTVGGIAQIIVGHPLDTIKVRLQTQCATIPVYNGTLDCTKKIFASEGLLGLYSGATAPLRLLCLKNVKKNLCYRFKNF